MKAISELMGYTHDDSTLDNITKQCTFESMKFDPLADPDTVYRSRGLVGESTSFLCKGVLVIGGTILVMGSWQDLMLNVLKEWQDVD